MGFPLVMVPRSFGVEAKGGYTLSTWPWKETTHVDVPRYKKCVQRRANALAPPTRLLMRRPLFWLVANDKCVPAHKRQLTKRTSDCLPIQRAAPRMDATGIDTTYQNLRDPQPFGLSSYCRSLGGGADASRYVLWWASVFRASLSVSDVRPYPYPLQLDFVLHSPWSLHHKPRAFHTTSSTPRPG